MLRASWASKSCKLLRVRAGHLARASIGTASSSGSTVNPSEVEFFSRLSSQWWDENGETALLHRMNPPRVSFIREKIRETLLEDATARGQDDDPSISSGSAKVLDGLEAADVGCGGGLLSESLARLGARTIGIDPSESNVMIARRHAAADPALSSGDILQYKQTSAEELLRENKQYDIVCSMEVLEHVDNPKDFLRSCAGLVKPGGHLFLSTISRTPLAWFLSIFLAEHALRRVTVGTHQYSKFIQPSELVQFFHEDMGWISRLYDGSPARKEAEVRGIVFLPWEGAWKVMPRGTIGTTECNYLFWARKPPS